jgi:hypothetical protein
LLEARHTRPQQDDGGGDAPAYAEGFYKIENGPPWLILCNRVAGSLCNSPGAVLNEVAAVLSAASCPQTILPQLGQNARLGPALADALDEVEYRSELLADLDNVYEMECHNEAKNKEQAQPAR